MADYYSEYLKLKREEQELKEKLNKSHILTLKDQRNVQGWQETHESQVPALTERVNRKRWEEEYEKLQAENEKSEGISFFDSGAFGDDKGNFFTDLGDTIGGTVMDFITTPLKGAVNIVEGLGDIALYGVGEVADFLGADSLGEGAKNIAKKNATDGLFAIFEDYSKNSVFGNTSQAILEGIGQVTGMMATGGIGKAAGLSNAATTALTTTTNFASSAGSGISEAYEQGATDKEAWTYGTIAGAGEALTEMIFGGLGKSAKALGIGKGLSSADDMLAEALSDKISNRLGKKLVQMGVKATGEGVEEVLSGIISAAGKKASYMSEQDFKDIIEDEKLLDQFIVGAITSGIMQGGDVVQSTASGRDYISGVTANEQKVIDKELKNRIAEAEKEGTKLGRKDKIALREQVQKDLERGYISIDTIESTLGGETYSSYKTAVDNETKLEEEIKELENLPNAQITVKQSERLQEARKELEELKQKDEKTSLKTKLDEEISTLTVKDTFLRESYNEKGRRSQFYEADVSKYDKGQQDTIQRAIDSGVLNNTNKTHEFVDMIAKISADKGVSFNFTDSKKLKESGFAIEGKTIQGYVQGNEITLNVSSPKVTNKVVGHEITHVLEGTELYEELKTAVKNYAETKGEYQTRYDELAKLYENVEGANIENELTADLVGDYLFSDEDFVNNLSTEKPSIFKRIYEEIKYLVKMVAPGSKEAKQLEKVKKTFEKVYKEHLSKNTHNEIRYSLRTSETGKKYVEIDTDQDIFIGLDESASRHKAREVILEKFAGTVIGEKEGKPVVATKRTAKEYAWAKKRSTQGEAVLDKMKASTELNNLLEASTFIEHATYEEVKERHPEALDGIDTYKATFKVGDNWYEGIINILNCRNVRVFYDVTKLRSIGGNELPVIANSPAAKTNASNSIITPSEQNASDKAQFSLASDSDMSPYGTWSTRGSDIMYIPPMEDLGPVREDIESKVSADDLGPVRTDIATSQGTITIPDDSPIRDDLAPNPDNFGKSIKTVEDRVNAQIENAKIELDKKKRRKEASYKEYNRRIANEQDYLRMESDQNSRDANIIRDRIDELIRDRDDEAVKLEKSINDLKERIKKLSAPEYKMMETRKQKQKEIQKEMTERIGDTTNWKDKKSGMGYKVHTLKRNLRDVIGDKEKADSIYRALQGRYNHNEALLNKESRSIKKAYADMKINKYEDQYIQMLGEYRHNPDTTLTSDKVNGFYEKHKKHIDTKKVDKAIDMARDTYDTLFTRVNEVLKEFGIREVPYREGYFPHFTKEPQGLLAKLLNWKKEDNSIPTDIAGLTEHFKPNKSYQSFSQKRTGDVTDYSFLTGLDSYVYGALDWIYHIEDIQRFRGFENAIRYQYTEEGIKEQIKELENSEKFDADELQDQIDAIYAKTKNPLNNLVQNLRTHTNLLAGKKNTMDRAMEENFNRNVYSIMKNGSSRINANMVAGSISSALTNFIPITQSWGQVSPISSLKAMRDTIKSTMLDDGTIDKSDFLTNRLRGDEKLSKTAWDKASDKISGMMEAIDSFTSQTVWRSKYIENIANGMSEAEAIQNADEFAEGVMAGRSRGNMPVAFESKNFITKIFTAFQLEVANQYDYMLKDMPQDMKNKTVGKLTKAYGSMFIGAYVYNALYSSLVGRDAAFDPLGIIEELLKDLFDNEEDEPADITKNLIKSVGEELPYIGGLVFGGGRIPISSALPYGEGIWEAVENTIDDVGEGNYESVVKEWLNPVYYLALPAGGGQLKKTVEGLAMFDDDNPISGSYTDSGNLRFSVEDTPLNKIQAALFGQWASENARDYFDNERQPLKEKQIEEYAELSKLGMTMQEYWDYREGLKAQESVDEKFDYVAGLDASVEEKNIMINNVVDRKEEVDLSNYDDYSTYEEFDYAIKNPEKYIVSKAVGDFKDYSQYIKALGEIESDKDENGETISGTRKDKVIKYLNSLDAEYESKILLYKMEYPSDDTYNQEIVDYLNKRKDISYSDMEAILKQLGFEVEADGTIRW